MKKMFVLVSVIAIVLSGCGNDEKAKAEADKKAAHDLYCKEFKRTAKDC